MAIDALRMFLEAAGGDPTIQEDVELALRRADDREVALAALAAQHGFDVSADDVRELLAASPADAELSDAELGRVAGGVASVVGGTSMLSHSEGLDANIWGNAMPLHRK